MHLYRLLGSFDLYNMTMLIGIIIGVFLTPFLLILEIEADATPKEKHTRVMKIYLWLRDFLTY